MKKLILVRHAKSSWEYDVGDIDRPLKKRGINDAKLVSNEFRKHKLEVEHVFSSPANRALSTCKIFLNNLNISPNKLEITDKLYDFGGQKVVNFIKSLDEIYNIVMIFGHNHAFTSIVNTFGDQYVDNLPTSGLVVLEFNIDKWSELKQGNTVISIFPRQFKN